jgi:hypothetical protein
VSRLNGTAQTSSRWDAPRLLAVGVFAFFLWQLADVVEAHIPLSLAWAYCDEIGHGSVAVLAMLWTQPRWGWRPIIAAALAGTLIDVDHAIAARSLSPIDMMSLAARPPSHSLLAAVAAGALTGLVAGPRFGFGVAVGVITHVLRDAQEKPGVPLLIPLVVNPHVILPAWVLPASMLALAATVLGVDRLRDRRR